MKKINLREGKVNGQFIFIFGRDDGEERFVILEAVE